MALPAEANDMYTWLQGANAAKFQSLRLVGGKPEEKTDLRFCEKCPVVTKGQVGSLELFALHMFLSSSK